MRFQSKNLIKRAIYRCYTKYKNANVIRAKNADVSPMWRRSSRDLRTADFGEFLCQVTFKKGDVDALIEQPNWSQQMQLASMKATTASFASLGSDALRTPSDDGRAGFHSA
jgi:hypothetical protein